MVVVIGGIFIKAIPMLFPPSGVSYAYQTGCVDELYPDSNLTLWGPEWTFSSEETREESGSSCGNACLKGIGIGMVLVGEFFHGLQFVYESKYMNEYDLHPLKVVGFEGICGVLTLAVLLWPAYFITFDKTGIMEGVALGPEGRFE